MTTRSRRNRRCRQPPRRRACGVVGVEPPLVPVSAGRTTTPARSPQSHTVLTEGIVTATSSTAGTDAVKSEGCQSNQHPQESPQKPKLVASSAVPLHEEATGRACLWGSCTEILDSPIQLALHVQAHVDSLTTVFKCQWRTCCNRKKRRTDLSWLRKHLTQHTGVLPFPCPMPGCSASFHTPHTLKFHVESHLRDNKKRKLKQARARLEARHEIQTALHPAFVQRMMAQLADEHGHFFLQSLKRDQTHSWEESLASASSCANTLKKHKGVAHDRNLAEGVEAEPTRQRAKEFASVTQEGPSGKATNNNNQRKCVVATMGPLHYVELPSGERVWEVQRNAPSPAAPAHEE